MLSQLVAALVLVLAVPFALGVALVWVQLRPTRRAYSATRMAPPSTMLLPDERR
jgi:hypothetical protein